MMRDNNGNGDVISEENTDGGGGGGGDNGEGDCWRNNSMKNIGISSSVISTSEPTFIKNGIGNGVMDMNIKNEKQSQEGELEDSSDYYNDQSGNDNNYNQNGSDGGGDNFETEFEKTYAPGESEIKMEDGDCEENVDNGVHNFGETNYGDQEISDSTTHQQSPLDNEQTTAVSSDLNDNHDDENQEQQQPLYTDPNIWTLPAKRDDCTLEEIRRGQVINQIPPNECPVIGCGKKINENRIEPSPGTIASGLRTHVLFVHYENRRAAKKRKLGWTAKKKNQASPKKQAISISSPSTSRRDFELSMDNPNELTTGLNLSTQRSYPQQKSSTSIPGSIINRKVKQLAARQSVQMSSLQSLMQATGGTLSVPKPTSLHQQTKTSDTTTTNTSNNCNNNLNSPAASSLYSILAGLTQANKQMNQPQLMSKNVKTAQGANTINISQCTRPNSVINTTHQNNNNNNNSNRPAVCSSLLSLLNEKISGNVASSLQAQLKKNAKATIATNPRHGIPSPASSSFNSSSILNSLCSGNGDNRSSYDNSFPLDSFIESIAMKTGSNIGPTGIAEAKRIIEKFTHSLVCSSQTIADHYIAPYAGDIPQQKPEISSSDIILAYKMMHKSHGQP